MSLWSLRPGRRELLLFAAAYLLYSLARWACVGDTDVATQHAHWIVDLERSFSIDVEGSVQRALEGTVVIWLLNHLYIAAQLVVVPGALVFLYRRDRLRYEQLRNTVLLTWLVALPIYALYPVCLLYTSPSPRDLSTSRMPSSA